MTFHYLKTKLDIPATRRKKLTRPTLIRLLTRENTPHVILVSAPAGYGKTSILVEWSAIKTEPFAWITLDETDNDPIRFFGYLVESLKRIHPRLGSTEDYLSSYPSVAVETSLTILLNALADYNRPLFIVLDDYHTISNPVIHDMLTFLIQHAAIGIRFIISTRVDPPLSLDRWRMKGNLLEVKQDDFSFTDDDASMLLNRVMGLNLAATDIVRINRKTEGWIAGLHIAGLWLAGKEDKTDAISCFSGSHSYIMNYLVQEVISRLPEHQRSFLLKTSLLDELSEELCNELTNRKDSRQLLEQLQSDNQFIVRVDHQGKRFRLHQLFRDVLRDLMQREHPDLIPSLHQRACRWYADNNYLDLAIAHAFKGGNQTKAVHLIEQYVSTALVEGPRATVREWIERLPEEIIHQRPILSLMHAWSIMNAKTAAADELFRLRLQAAQKFDRHISQEAQNDIVTGMNPSNAIKLLKAVFEFERGNPSRLFLPDLKQMLDQPDDVLRSPLLFLMAHIQIRTMQLDNALLTLDDAISLAASKNFIYLATYATYLKAWILFQKGKLHEALHVCQTSPILPETTTRYPQDKQPLGAAFHVIIGAVYHEWGRAEEAEVLLDSALKRLGQTSEIGIIINGVVRQGLVKLWLGREPAIVKSILTELSLLNRFHQHAAPLADGLQMLLSTRLGNSPQTVEQRVELAGSWTISPAYFEQELTYYQNHEWELSTTLIRIQLALKRAWQDRTRSESTSALESYLEIHLNGAQKWGLFRWSLELMLTLAMVHELNGQQDQSETVLELALGLAAPENAIRVFVENHEMLRRPLFRLNEQGKFVDFINNVASISATRHGPSRISSADAGHISSDALDLSARELEVLKLIAEGHSNQDIASDLFISLNTVKSHISHIYEKLGVNRRTKAISTAKKQGILP